MCFRPISFSSQDEVDKLCGARCGGECNADPNNLSAFVCFSLATFEFKGKGYLKGTRTMGNFVPAQHSDYIFSTVGEEWGFLGSVFIILLYTLLILRIFYLSEHQKNKFSRVYGYSTASILFIHFLINIGMVLGLTPTIGIPLPFLSYGGSSLIAFTILLFVFLRLDANKINEW